MIEFAAPVEGHSKSTKGNPEGSTVMGFPEHTIKDAILHPDPGIRDRATSYFAKSYRSDVSIMPLVVRAVLVPLWLMIRCRKPVHGGKE